MQADLFGNQVNTHAGTFMHQSFVFTAPKLRGWPGNSRAKVQGNYVLIVSPVPGNYQGFNILNLTPVRFSVV